MTLEEKIRIVQDFPKEGIEFMDITTLLNDAEGLKMAIDACADQVKDLEFDVIIGPEARGFIIGTPLAYAMNKPFVPIRKPGKLPAETLSYEYDLEYGTDTLEIHKDAIKPGQKVLIADDLLATGGTVEAVTHMVEELGGIVVGVVFLIELEFLKGREKLSNYDIYSVIKK